MSAQGKRIRNRNLVVADAVGVAHFVVANLCVVLGQTTDIFSDLGGEYPGLFFVYRYFDAPVAAFFSGLAYGEGGDVFFTFLVGELIIVLSSILYGALGYAFTKLIFLLNE